MQAFFAELAFEQAVGQERQHVDQQHAFDAIVFVQENGRDQQIGFADAEALLHAVFSAIKG